MADDGHIDHAKLQQRYLFWHESSYGWRFSPEAWSSFAQADQNRQWFQEDGYAGQIIKLTVVDGKPVAEWVE